MPATIPFYRHVERYAYTLKPTLLFCRGNTCVLSLYPGVRATGEAANAARTTKTAGSTARRIGTRLNRQTC